MADIKGVCSVLGTRPITSTPTKTAKMKMVIQGETPGQFCRQLKDPAKNGNRSLAQIMHHVAHDELVGWGWNPGDGRTLPPLNRADFVATMQQWVDNGAACPQ